MNIISTFTIMTMFATLLGTSFAGLFGCFAPGNKKKTSSSNDLKKTSPIPPWSLDEHNNEVQIFKEASKKYFDELKKNNSNYKSGAVTNVLQKKKTFNEASKNPNIDQAATNVLQKNKTLNNASKNPNIDQVATNVLQKNKTLNDASKNPNIDQGYRSILDQWKASKSNNNGRQNFNPNNERRPATAKKVGQPKSSMQYGHVENSKKASKSNFGRSKSGHYTDEFARLSQTKNKKPIKNVKNYANNQYDDQSSSKKVQQQTSENGLSKSLTQKIKSVRVPSKNSRQKQIYKEEIYQLGDYY